MEGARPLSGDIAKNTNCHPFGDVRVSAITCTLNLSTGMPVIRGLRQHRSGKARIGPPDRQTRKRGRLLTAALGWTGWRVLAHLGGLLLRGGSSSHTGTSVIVWQNTTYNDCDATWTN